MTQKGRKVHADLACGKSLVERMMFVDGNMMLVDCRERKDPDGSVMRTETVRRPSRQERRLIGLAFVDAVSKDKRL